MPESPAKSPQYDGIVILNKPAGPSSAQCLVPFKRLGQKKIGHGGTLDPAASGVLPILLGQATKLARWLQNDGRKIYSGRIRLGVTTDTWDMQGTVLARNSVEHLSEEKIREAVADWVNIAEQAVPAFSAAKHNGQPLYRMARKGQIAPSKTKKVKIFAAGALAIGMPFVDFRVTCGSGTYIRSLAHSLGERLECGAALERLTREYSQPYDLCNACTLDEIGQGLLPHMVLPLQTALPHWPCISLGRDEEALVRNGRPLPAPADAAGNVFLCREGKAVAIAEAGENEKGRCWVVARGLWNI